MSEDPDFMRRQDPARVGEALTRMGITLGMHHGTIAQALGVSRRSVSRWALEGVRLPRSQLVPIAELALARRPDLAAEIAALAGETLESLGLVPAPPAQTLGPLPPHKLADLVVFAAAEACDVSPRAVRPGLLAAVRTAREVGLTLETLEALLTAPPASRA
jgi:hypothetical protein